MGIEIEHKYLVNSDEYIHACDPDRTHKIRQGYLSKDPARTVRIRIIENKHGAKAFLTVKGKTELDRRSEFEYQVPVADAAEMLDMCCGSLVEKTRYIVFFGGYTWEVDRFEGSRQGLVVAEIELNGSHHNYPLPPFVGKEVTGNPDYYNSML